MTNIDIRLIEEKEIPLVHHLMLQAFEEYRKLDVPSSALDETVEGLANSIHLGLEQALVCLVDGTPIGCARFQMKDDYLYFSRLSVVPEVRGKGIATSIISWLEGVAKENEKSRLICKVRASLPKNIRLYEKLGFYMIEEKKVTNPNGFLVNTAQMEKAL